MKDRKDEKTKKINLDQIAKEFGVKVASMPKHVEQERRKNLNMSRSKSRSLAKFNEGLKQGEFKMLTNQKRATRVALQTIIEKKSFKFGRIPPPKKKQDQKITLGSKQYIISYMF